MTDPAELLALRLTLLAIILLFVLLTAAVLRGTLRTRPRTAQAGDTSASLIVESPARTGLHPGTALPLAGETTIGRDIINGIVLADGSVSGRHAIIEISGGNWTVRDLGSTNGTRLDGEHVAGEPVPLHHDASLLVGAVRFRISLNGSRHSPARRR